MMHEKPSLYGWEPTLDTPAQLHDALDKAFDYRGDVTLRLRDGTEVVGYVFNRATDTREPYVEVFPADRPNRLRVYDNDIVGIRFTGIDTAAGKSWAAWVAKHPLKKSA